MARALHPHEIPQCPRCLPISSSTCGGCNRPHRCCSRSCRRWAPQLAGAAANQSAPGRRHKDGAATRMGRNTSALVLAELLELLLERAGRNSRLRRFPPTTLANRPDRPLRSCRLATPLPPALRDLKALRLISRRGPREARAIVRRIVVTPPLRDRDAVRAVGIRAGGKLPLPTHSDATRIASNSSPRTA
jgi:hypothetical protein